MKAKLLAFGVALLAVATVGVVQLQTQALDSTRDRDRYAVVWNGTMTPTELRNAYDNGRENSPNIPRIFNAMGIGRAALNATFVNGVVHRNGTVTVGGKVVATGAKTAIRNIGSGTAISGTNARKVSTSAMADDQTAMVAMRDGKFLFAVMKPCGNPVSATPKNPEPQPKAACTGLNVTKLERTKFRFNATASVSGGAKVNGYIFKLYKNGNVVDTLRFNSGRTSYSTTYSQPNAGDYRVKAIVKTSEGQKDGKQCQDTFTVRKPQQTPVAECKSLSVTKLSRTQFRFDAAANVSGGVSINSYLFEVMRGTKVIASKSVASSSETAAWTYTQSQAGDYTARVTVRTSEGAKSGDNCTKPFTVTPPEEKEPSVEIEKFVENVKYKRVGVNVEYDYQIIVRNTGDVDLTNVEVTDTPDQGITLTDASQGSVDTDSNTWSYTIPTLMKGEEMDFTLSAKIPVFLAGKLTNTVCVDAPQVPGNPDDCDSAEVDVPEAPVPGKIEVCVLKDNVVREIDQSEYDANPELYSTDLSDCAEEELPEVLPETGPAEMALQAIGAMSLVGSSVYYAASRRSL